MITIIMGILSSVVAEIITAINKKLQGTVLQGDAAFLVAFVIAFIGAVGAMIMTPGFQWSSLTNLSQIGATFGGVFTVSQVYFLMVMQKLNLDVQAPASTVAGTTTETVKFQG